MWGHKNIANEIWTEQEIHDFSKLISAHLFFKLLAFLWRECICFGNKWDDIHFFMQTLHKFNIQRFKSEIHI